jgi:hypothetical protein
MSAPIAYQIRKEELRRRVEALPKEVTAWQDRTQAEVDENLHFSQLQAIGALMDAFKEQQEDLLAQMDPAGDSAAFQDAAFELVKSIIRAQRFWDFFRDKLDLRFSPSFKEPLWVADTVAWDCYRPVLDRAAGFGILPASSLREPPLTYLTAEFSPATWVRKSRPNDGRDYHLGEARLPIPVIELPWDHVENTWEFMSLHHEVGHDLDADLKLRAPLAKSLEKELDKANVPANRIDRWLDWLGEILADLIGLQLGGPAFAESLMHLLLLPANLVTILDPDDPHPTNYPRILMNAAYAPTMVANHQPLADHAQQIKDRWIALYGPQPQFDDFLADFPTAYKAIMDTPLPELKCQTVRDLMPYTQADDQRIRAAAGYMLTGMNWPSDLAPRHAVSAARLAVTQAAQGAGGVTMTDTLLTGIHQRAIEVVRANAPDGLRAADDSTPHQQFIAGFLDKLPF